MEKAIISKKQKNEKVSYLFMGLEDQKIWFKLRRHWEINIESNMNIDQEFKISKKENK